MRHDPKSWVSSAVPFLIGHFYGTGVMSCHQLNVDAIESIWSRRVRLLHLVGRQITRHIGSLLGVVIRHRNREPASPPTAEDTVFADLACDHQARQSPKVRISRALLPQFGKL